MGAFVYFHIRFAFGKVVGAAALGQGFSTFFCSCPQLGKILVIAHYN